MHHIVVLVSIFVSLLGTLLILEKINAAAEPIPTATVANISFPENENTVNSKEQVKVHITNTVTED